MLNQSIQGLHKQTWFQAISELEQSAETYVIVTVLGTSGSTPRANGTKMVVAKQDIYATIGGGHLEYKAIKHARTLITQGNSTQVIEKFQLGASLGQCCGGQVMVLFEVFVNQRMNLDIYGAGHVAQALIPILGELPINIRWIDSRADIFPSQLPANVTKVIDDYPVDQVQSATDNSASLILTHNHQLDFELCQAILKNNKALWLGVIGSETKAKKFKYRLSQKGFSSQQVQQMQCPVGLKEVTGKLPMEVAIAIAGQLIALYQNQLTDQQPRQWSDLNKVLIHLSEVNNQRSEHKHNKQRKIAGNV